MELNHTQIDNDIYELIQKGQVQEAIVYGQHIIETTQEREHLYVYALMGQAYMWLSDYPKALEELYRGLRLAEDIKDERNEARIYTVMAACEILHTNNVEKAKVLQIRAYNLAKKLNVLELIMSNSNNLGVIYTNEGAFDDALVHFEEIIKYREQAQGYRQLNIIIAAAINIGDIHFKKERYDQAIKYWEEAVEVCKVNNIPRHLAIAYFNIASVYRVQCKYQKALRYYDKALELQIGMGNKKEASICYKDISDVYEALEDYKNAFVFYKGYSETTESIVNDETRLQMKAVSGKYTDDLKNLNEQMVETNKQLEKAKNEIEYLYIRDYLTDTYNRRGLEREIEMLRSEYKDKQVYYSIMMIDIDDFKMINDRYGHLIGDKILSTCALLLKDIVANDGFVSRYGGEEFVIVLKHRMEDEIIRIAQKILTTIQNTPYELESKSVMHYFVTIGISMLQTLELKEHIKEADHNLYKGKKQSKNCIVFTD